MNAVPNRDAVSPRTARWAGAWVDLLDDLDGAQVLVLDAGPGRASIDLVSRGASVTFADDDAERVAARRAVLGDASRLAVSCSKSDGLARAPFDVIVLDSVLPSATVLQELVGCLSGTGRLAVVVDNSLSPLRLLD